MPNMIIDGIEVEFSPGANVLQVALDAGFDVPHYCYHPGLSVAASCRLCLMEMQMPHLKTGEMVWSPKLIPSCQTPAAEGMVVRFDSEKVVDNQRHVMEHLLANHPLDCPVCDQAGECYLQDYSEKFGNAASRMVDCKVLNPKKDIGPRTMLYQDRCILCTRCVRFTREISGTGELCVVNRGDNAEIDVFPGEPLDNKLQGNVVDICPVGSHLDKDFLFKQRVWFLNKTPSICPGCSTGCTIRIDHNEGRVYRLKPRYNPGVNDWWICDEGRFGFKYVEDENRITVPLVRRGAESVTSNWDDVPEIVAFRFRQCVERHRDKKMAAVLSPMMACEEAWLLAKFIRDVSNDSVLVAGLAPVVGQDEHFPVDHQAENAKFTIRREKCPNRRGVEMVIAGAGGPTLDFDKFLEAAAEGQFAAAWIVGGYPHDWVTKDIFSAVEHIDVIVAQDIFGSKLCDRAAVVLPACPWTEREGTFVNYAGKIQVFDRAVSPPDGARFDGQLLFEAAGYSGLYAGDRIRELMSKDLPQFANVCPLPEKPVHQH